NGFSVNAGQALPGESPVAGTKHVSGTPLYAPGSNIDDVRMLRVDDDPVEYVFIPRSQMRHQGPGTAVVIRKIKLSSGCTQEYAVGMTGIVSQAANISAIWS